MPVPFVVDALSRLKSLFQEMPGTEWTVNDAARLSGLEDSVCRALLDAMRDAGVLTQRANGSYVGGHLSVDESRSNAATVG